MPINLAGFNGEPPFDAQYVGTVQSLFGWVGRSGLRRAQDEVDALVSNIVAELAPPGQGPRVGFAVPQSRTVAVRGNGWASRILESAALMRNPARREGEGESRGRTARAGNIFRRMFERDDGGREELVAAPTASATPTRRQTSYRQAIELLRQEPGFSAHFDASLREADRKVRDWVDLINELSLERPNARLLLSPIGLLDLYREYYFDLGTRLGPPIEHIWIAPGSELELVESYSRTEYTFVETEQGISQSTETTETLSEAETFSEEVERTQQRDLSVGVAVQGGVNYQVWQVSANASFDYANSLTQSKRQAVERTREASSKASREMKRTSRVLTRRSTEETRTNTRTHRLTNPSGEVRHLEMRRKYLHVGVQVQHLGTSLCWQLYVPGPGKRLELPELVHVGASEDFLNETPPEGQVEPPPPEVVSQQLTIRLEPVRTQTNTDQDVDTNNDYFLYSASQYQGRWVATDDPEEAPDASDDVILAQFPFTYPPASPGYKLASVQLGAFRGTDPSKSAPSRFTAHVEITDANNGVFTVIVHDVNFEKNPSIEVTAELLYQPPPASPTPPPATTEAFTAAMQRKAREAVVKAVRERVKLASSIRPRHADDLRGEERSVVYQALLEQLVGSAKGSELHLLSELIQTLFDVDRMLYYVAPDWWDPHRNRATLNLPAVAGGTVTLSPADRARFSQDGDGRDTYLITEESEPAPMGRSLGWLAQLDGDDKRNMFLNSPWVKAVLPIRHGRERDAIAFLSQEHIEGADGLASNEIGASGQPTGRTLREALVSLADEIRDANQPDSVYAEGQRVFEEGFTPFDSRLRLDGEPLRVFAQWVEVVPTRQIVPVPYVIPEAFRVPAADDGGGG